MTLDTSPNSVLTKVAKSLVAAKRYSTTEEALWDMALSTVRAKMAYYRRRIRRLENSCVVALWTLVKEGWMFILFSFRGQVEYGLFGSFMQSVA